VKPFINEHYILYEVKVTHKVTHTSKCTSSFPEFFGVHTEKQQAIKKPAPKERWQKNIFNHPTMH